MMTNARRGEIALLLVKRQLRDRGLKLSPGFRRELGSMAKELGISLAEAEEFIRPIAQELFDETFPPDKQIELFETSTPEAEGHQCELIEHRD